MKNQLQYCKSCGHELASNAKRCPNCGAKQKHSHPIVTCFISLLIFLFSVVVVIAMAILISQAISTANDEHTVYTTPELQHNYTISNSGKDYSRNTESDPLPEATNEQIETDSTAIRPEFKAMMDEYVDFFEEYCAFMEEYQKNPSSVTLIGKYASMMTQYAEMVASMEAVDTAELNDAELLYYLEVTAQIETMLMDVIITE